MRLALVLFGAGVVLCGLALLAWAHSYELANAYWRRQQAEAVVTRLEPTVCPRDASMPDTCLTQYLVLHEDEAGVHYYWLDTEDDHTVLRAREADGTGERVLARVPGSPSGPPAYAIGYVYFATTRRSGDHSELVRVAAAGGDVSAVERSPNAQSPVFTAASMVWVDEMQVLRRPLGGGAVERVGRLDVAADHVRCVVRLAATHDAVAFGVERGGSNGTEVWLLEDGSGALRQLHLANEAQLELAVGDDFVFAALGPFHLETPEEATLVAIPRRGGAAQVLATLSDRTSIATQGNRALVASQQYHDDNDWHDPASRSWEVLAFDPVRRTRERLLRTDARHVTLQAGPTGRSLPIWLRTNGAPDRYALLAPGW